MSTRTKSTEADQEAAARAALGFVPAGKHAGEDAEAAAKKILSIQPAAPAKEPEGKPEPVNKATPAEPAKPAPEQPAVKAAQAEADAGDSADDGEPDSGEPESLEGETFSKDAVTEIAARAYKRGAASKKVKNMEEELNTLKAELTSMKREKAVNDLAAEYGLEPDLLAETKLEGEELRNYAQKLADAQPKQEAFGFQSVREAVNARSAQPMDAWAQLAAALH